jgi:hypothetical protein
VVEAFSSSARTITLLGITIDAAGATQIGLDGQTISLDQLFAQLTVDRTIIKARGSFSAGPPPRLTATEIEFE